MLLTQHDADSPERIIRRTLDLEKNIVVGVVLKELAIVVGPKIFGAWETVYGDDVIWTDVDNIRAIDGKEEVPAG